MSRHNVTTVDLYDIAADTELAVSVRWKGQPAEPDVGIMNRYAEIDCVSADLVGFGEIIFEPTEYHAEKIREEVGLEMDENPFGDERI